MEPVTHGYDTAGTLHVELRIPAGTIGVQATETTRTLVTISGARAPDDITVDLTPSPGGGDRLVIEPRDRKASRHLGRLRVDLTVPQGANLKSETGSGDLDVHGPIDSLWVRSASGDVSFDEVRGDVVVKTASGDVHGGSVSGDLAVHGASGDVSVRAVAGTLVCRTASGDLSVEELGGDAQVSGASGDIRLGSTSRGSLSLQTVSGDVKVGVVPGVAVWLDLSSTTGDTVSDLDAADRPAADAALEIRARAVSGDVRVHRATGGDIAR